MQEQSSGESGARKILANISWLFVDRGIRLAVGLIIGVWVARYLGPANYGEFAFVTALVSIFAALAAMGLPGIVVRELTRCPHQANEILATSFVIQIFAGLLAWSLSVLTLYALTSSGDQSRALVLILGSTLLLKASGVSKLWFESRVESKYVVYAENIALCVAAGLKVVLIQRGWGLEALALIVLFETALSAALLLLIFRNFYQHLPTQFSLAKARSLLADSWPLIISSVAVIAYMRIDQVMIAKMLGSEAAGNYAVATVLSELWYFVPIAINASLRPKLFKLREVSRQAFLAKLQKLFNFMVWLSVPIAVVVSVFAEDIVHMLYGQQYQTAASVLVIHVWSAVFVFFNNAVWVWYFAENKQNLAAARVLIGLTLNVLLNYYLIPLYGIVGAAYATLISRFFVSMLGQLFSKDTRFLFFMMLTSLLTLGFGNDRFATIRK